MSVRSITLREYGQRCLNSPFKASALHGQFIVDCADELEHLERDLQTMRTLNAGARGLLDRADQAPTRQEHTMNRYFEHTAEGFWLALDALGLAICYMGGVCMVAFGWPFYLLGKWAARRGEK